MYRIICFMFLVTMLAGITHADVIYLQNGDRITGEISLIWDDEVTIEPSYSDKFTVDVEEISSIETDMAFDVELYDGRQGEFRFAGADGNGNLMLESPYGQINIGFFNIKRVEEIEEYFEWEARADLSHSLSKGNSDTQAVNFNGAIQWKFGERRNLLEINNIYESVDGAATRDSRRINNTFEWIYKDPWFLAINTTYNEDAIALLDYRISINPAIGYDIWDEPVKSLNVQLGGGYQSEENAGVESQSTLVEWRLRYRQDFFSDDLELYHNHSISQNFQGRENVLIYTTTGIRYDITDDIYLNIELKYDLDTNPAEGASRENLTTLLGAGIEFD